MSHCPLHPRRAGQECRFQAPSAPPPDLLGQHLGCEQGPLPSKPGPRQEELQEGKLRIRGLGGGLGLILQPLGEEAGPSLDLTVN